MLRKAHSSRGSSHSTGTALERNDFITPVAEVTKTRAGAPSGTAEEPLPFIIPTRKGPRLRAPHLRARSQEGRGRGEPEEEITADSHAIKRERQEWEDVGIIPGAGCAQYQRHSEKQASERGREREGVALSGENRTRSPQDSEHGAKNARGTRGKYAGSAALTNGFTPTNKNTCAAFH